MHLDLEFRIFVLLKYLQAGEMYRKKARSLHVTLHLNEEPGIAPKHCKM